MGRRGSGENIRRVDPSGPQFWTQVLDAREISKQRVHG